MRTILTLLVGGLVCWTDAAADTLITNTSYNASGSGLVTDSGTFDTFDPAIGTLNSVNISIEGFLNVGGSLIPSDGTSPFTIQASHEFAGLGSRGFFFGSASSFDAFVPHTGAGGNFSFVVSYSYGFTFTPITDLVGFLPGPSSFSAFPILTGPFIPAVSPGIATPPLTIVGSTPDFFPTVAFPSIELVLTSSINVISPDLLFVNNSDSGSVIVTYDFTPAATPPAAPIPEPATSALVAMGVVAMWQHRRRRARR